MKKNIILALSLILSSVATLNLTSCSDDDDDDANHAPKTVQVEEQNQDKESEVTFYSYMLGAGFGEDIEKQEYDSLLTVTVTKMAEYFQQNLTGMAKVGVKGPNKHTPILYITAQSGKEDQVKAKLVEMNKDMSGLTEMLKKAIPQYGNGVCHIKDASGNQLITFHDLKR